MVKSAGILALLVAIVGVFKIVVHVNASANEDHGVSDTAKRAPPLASPVTPSAPQAQWLRPSDELAFPIAPGRYRVHVTASADGATISWVGAPCEQSDGPRQLFDFMCVVPDAAQLIVANPTDSDTSIAVSIEPAPLPATPQ